MSKKPRRQYSIMRIFLVSICSLSLACLAGAAPQQQSDQDTSNPKGKKGHDVTTTTQPVVTPKGTSKRSFSTTGATGATTGATGKGYSKPGGFDSNTPLQTHQKGLKTGQTQTQTNVTDNDIKIG